MKQYLIDNRVAGIQKLANGTMQPDLTSLSFRTANFKTIYVKTTYVACMTNKNTIIFMDPTFIDKLATTDVNIESLFHSAPPISTTIYKDKELKNEISVLR